jgi:hypothetical protein
MNWTVFFAIALMLALRDYLVFRARRSQLPQEEEE